MNESAVFNSAVPPLMDLAVAPMVRIPSPNCDTEVLVLDAVFAIWSTIVSASDVSIPRADIASVTMSEAEARSILPAAAKFRTVGKVSTISCVSLMLVCRSLLNLKLIWQTNLINKT